MPLRRTDELHLRRWSHPQATYFVTCCTHRRAVGLLAEPIAAAIHAGMEEADRTADTSTLAFTVMPDHVHWLFVLGHRLSLGRVIARWKMQTQAVMIAARLEWQRDFYEHRLRADEPVEPYVFYVFLNPYRAGLIPAVVAWPNWRCPVAERFRFTAQLEHGGGPPPEWIAERVPPGLAVGE